MHGGGDSPAGSPPRRAGCRRMRRAWRGTLSARTSAPVCGASIMTSWPSTTPTNSPTWSMEPRARLRRRRGRPAPAWRPAPASVCGRTGPGPPGAAPRPPPCKPPARGPSSRSRRPASRRPIRRACRSGTAPTTPRRRRRRPAAGEIAAPARRGVGLGQGEHLGHVGGRVVVGEHGAGQVGPAGRAVGAQQAGRGVDGVRRVVGARRHRPAGRHRLVVGGEGGRLELHGAFGARRVGAAVHAGQVRLAVVRLDGADGGEDRPGQPRAGGRRLLVERQHRRRDRAVAAPEAPGAPPPTPSIETADASTAVPTTAAARPTDSPAASTPLIGAAAGSAGRRNRGGGHGRERSLARPREHGKRGFVILGA